jgi:ribosomal protein S1
MTPEAKELYFKYLEINKDENPIVLATRAVVKTAKKGDFIELREAIAIARKFLDNNDQ